MQFIGVADVRPRLLLHLRDGCGIERADFFEHRGRQHSPHFDGAGAAFLERCVVEVGVRIRIENFVRELRRYRRIDGEAADSSLLDAAQDFGEPFDIERFGEYVFHHLAHQRMVGNLDVAFDIFLAGGDVGKDRSEKIVGAHALDLRRNFFAALKTQQSEGASCIPAPARAKDR